MYICMHVSMHVYTYVSMYTRAYVCMYVRTCVGTYFIHSFITSIYIAPLQVGLLRGAPNPNTTKGGHSKLRGQPLKRHASVWWRCVQMAHGEDLDRLNGGGESSVHFVWGIFMYVCMHTCKYLQKISTHLIRTYGELCPEAR